ncbi:hypothetical protein N9251_00685 [Gammaproteobacteria bacterium]|nr:hypothetical protein [Gammaproteobacteria bacterium]
MNYIKLSKATKVENTDKIFDTSFIQLLKTLLPIHLRNINLISFSSAFFSALDFIKTSLNIFAKKSDKHIHLTGQIGLLNEQLKIMDPNASIQDINDQMFMKVYSQDNTTEPLMYCFSGKLTQSGSNEYCPINFDEGIIILAIIYNMKYLGKFFQVSYSDKSQLQKIKRLVEKYRLVTKYPKYKYLKDE